jgi:hypothetical protein
MVDAFCHVPSSQWSAAVSACTAIGGENGSVTVHFTAAGLALNADRDTIAIAVRFSGESGTGRTRRAVRIADLVADGSVPVEVAVDDEGRLSVRGVTIDGWKTAQASSSAPKVRPSTNLTINVSPTDLQTLLTAVSSASLSKRQELDGKLLLTVRDAGHDGTAVLTASAAGMFAAATSTVNGELISHRRSDTFRDVWLHGPALLAASAALDAKAPSWQLGIATTATHHRVTLRDGSVDITVTVDPTTVPDIAAAMSTPTRARYWDLDIAELPTLAAFLERLPKPLAGTSPFAQIRNDRGGDGTPHQAQVTVHINGLIRKCTAKAARRRDGLAKDITTTCAEDVAVDVPLAQLQALVATAQAHRSPSLFLRGYAPYRTMSKLFAYPCPDRQGTFTAVTVGRVPTPT